MKHKPYHLKFFWKLNSQNLCFLFYFCVVKITFTTKIGDFRFFTNVRRFNYFTISKQAFFIATCFLISTFTFLTLVSTLMTDFFMNVI